MPTNTMYHLLSATKKSREACVARVKKLAEKHGATIEMHEFNGPREIGLTLVFGPFKCSMEFDGASNVGAFLGAWHVSTKSDLIYPATFAADIRGSMNTYHYSKATTCKNDWHAFLHSLESGLVALAIEYPQFAADRVSSDCRVFADDVQYGAHS